VAETTCQPGWVGDRSVATVLLAAGGDGRRRGGGRGGDMAPISAYPASPPLLSTVAIVLGCDWATASALPITTGGGSATNDLEMEGALSDDAVFTVSRGRM